MTNPTLTPTKAFIALMACLTGLTAIGIGIDWHDNLGGGLGHRTIIQYLLRCLAVFDD